MYVSMNSQGEITFSRRVFELLCKPEAVLVLFDAANARIGLKPTVSVHKNAFGVGVKSKRSGARRVCARRTMEQFGIVVDQTIRFYDAAIDEERILVLDLRTARVPPSVANHPRNRKKPSQADAEKL